MPLPDETSVDEDELTALCAKSEPHTLLADIPEALRPWLLPVNWERDRLWTIGREPIRIPLSELRWTYELPWWRGNDRRWFQVAPRAYLDAPHEHPEHHRRMLAIDLSYPIHVLRRRGRYVPLDGIHRTARADQLGHHTIDAIVLQLADLETFLVPAGSHRQEMSGSRE